MGNFFKSIAVLLSVPLLLSGCNSSATSAENQQSSIQEEENLSDNANENTSTETKMNSPVRRNWSKILRQRIPTSRSKQPIRTE